MTIGAGTIGEFAIAENPVSGPDNSIFLSLPIELDTRPPIETYARIRLNITEALALSAPIELCTGCLALYAPIELKTTEAIALSAPIEAAPVDGAIVDRTAGRWGVQILIDGVDYSARIAGTVVIEQSEDASAVANFTVIPSAGPIVPGDFISKRVKIDWIDKDGTGAINFQVTRFNGIISDPIYLPETGELNIQCTSDLQGVLDATTRAAINELMPDAKWSPFIFEDGADGWEYAQDRLRTIPAAIWHAPGGIIVTDWAAKLTPDFTLTDSELFFAGNYVPANRRALLNEIEIEFDYRFERRRQRTISCRWSTDQKFCEYLVKGYTLCQREMVLGAAQSGEWVIQDQVVFTPVPSSGTFKCFSGTIQNNIGWVNPAGGFIDQTFCYGARWTAARRWAQQVTERYSVKISAPQSVSGNGTMANRETFSLESDYDLTDWLNRSRFDTSAAATPGYTGVGGNIVAGDYRLGDIYEDATEDPDTGRDAANLARATMIAAGVADILRAHRQNSVRCVASFQPQMNLTHTLRIDSAHITAKGKVSFMRDVLSLETGDAVSEITIALSRHEGAGVVTPSPLDPIDPPTPTEETGIPTYIEMKTYIGGTKTTQPINPEWLGYFTNWLFDPNDDDPFGEDPQNPQTVSYPRQFLVEYPEISGGALDAFELTADQLIDVEIPNDELTLTQ